MRTAPLLAFVLIAFGCSRSPQPAAKATMDEPKQIVVSEPECDFSEYTKARVMDWLPQGILKQVPPLYPEEARRKGVTGRVVVKMLIRGDGVVEKVCAIGPPLLKEAAEAAALQWRFRSPSKRYVEETFTFNFDLPSAEAAIGRPHDCDFSGKQPMRANAFDWGRKVVAKVVPKYPPEAKRRRIKGEVLVHILTNRDGIVEQACAVNGPDLLRGAAESAALQWRFRQPTLNGDPIPYLLTQIRFNFVLDK